MQQQFSGKFELAAALPVWEILDPLLPTFGENKEFVSILTQLKPLHRVFPKLKTMLAY